MKTYQRKQKAFNIAYSVVCALFITLLASCGGGDDEPDDPNNPAHGKDGKIRYEAVVSDPAEYKLLVTYVDETQEAQQKEVESPFTYSRDAKHGDYLYISALAVAKNGAETPKTVTCKMYVNDKLFKEDKGEINAVVQYVFGVQ